MNAVARIAITSRVSSRCPTDAAITAADTTVPVMTPSPLIIPSGSRSGFTSGAVRRLSFVLMWLPVSFQGPRYASSIPLQFPGQGFLVPEIECRAHGLAQLGLLLAPKKADLSADGRRRYRHDVVAVDH